ncbi:hypothetical protein [Devosia sp. UYZn731]|uniref:hypothetical protein n=1 Tax=Devosia sp. UYZn731 TaxID=3156345 RepID=UPI003396B6DB
MTVTSILPLQGVLRMETKDGPLLVTLNRIGAASLVSGLAEFLMVEPADFVPTGQPAPN